MTASKDYRIYLESEFKEIHKKLDSNETQLDRIEIQTIKTNGCLTGAIRDIEDLKSQRDKYLETRVSKEMLCDVKVVVDELDKEIKEVKENLIEYNFFRKYPKLTILIVGIFVVTMFISLYGTFKTVNDSAVLKDIKQIESIK